MIGYWVELVKRGENSGIKNEYNFSQTMLRVKDPKKSIEFYQKLGMKVVEDRHFEEAKFSLYFLASSTAPDGSELKTMFAPVLELTHNHGTEDDDSFKHHNGNEDGRQGFGHIGFLVDNVYKAW
jgi:lactoylglutathione lyase